MRHKIVCAVLAVVASTATATPTALAHDKDRTLADVSLAVGTASTTTRSTTTSSPRRCCCSRIWSPRHRTPTPSSPSSYRTTGPSACSSSTSPARSPRAPRCSTPSPRRTDTVATVLRHHIDGGPTDPSRAALRSDGPTLTMLQDGPSGRRPGPLLEARPPCRQGPRRDAWGWRSRRSGGGSPTASLMASTGVLDRRSSVEAMAAAPVQAESRRSRDSS